jgi:hypothetical protein
MWEVMPMICFNALLQNLFGKDEANYKKSQVG